MNSDESKLQILDLTVTIIIVVVACVIGKLAMNRYDTWISFNGLAFGILVVGELIWWRVRKRVK